MGRCWCSQSTFGDGKVIWQPILAPLFNEGLMWRTPIASILGIRSGIYSFVDKVVVFHISSKQNFCVMGLLFWGFPQGQFIDHIDEYELSNHFWQDKELWSNFLSQKIVGWKFDNLGLADCCEWGGVDEGLVGEGSGGWLFKWRRPTSLIWAVGHEHIHVVEILLDYGANVSSFEIPQLQRVLSFVLKWNSHCVQLSSTLFITQLQQLHAQHCFLLILKCMWVWLIVCNFSHTKEQMWMWVQEAEWHHSMLQLTVVMSAWWIAF